VGGKGKTLRKSLQEALVWITIGLFGTPYFKCISVLLVKSMRAKLLTASIHLAWVQMRKAGETSRKSKNDSNHFEQNISAKLEKELNRKYLPGAEW
jgi:hypothetical protein